MAAGKYTITLEEFLKILLLLGAGAFTANCFWLYGKGNMDDSSGCAVIAFFLFIWGVALSFREK